MLALFCAEPSAFCSSGPVSRLIPKGASFSLMDLDPEVFHYNLISVKTPSMSPAMPVYVQIPNCVLRKLHSPAETSQHS